MILKNKRIMIVGWFNPKYSAEGLAQGFESNGIEVIRVAADAGLPERSGKFDYHMIEHYISVLPYKDINGKCIRDKYTREQQYEVIQFGTGKRLFYLKWIVNKLDKPIDCIIITQFENPPSIEDINVPVGYYYTETCDPSLPLGKNIDWLFYAFVGGLEKLTRIYPYYKQQWPITKLIPHAINAEIIPNSVTPFKDRKIKIGFKGLLDFNTMDNNPLVKYIYAERKRFVNLLFNIDQSEGDSKEPDFIYEKNTNWRDYAQFMHDTQIALNVPGIDGYINQRQYECLAFGCLLLQYKYKELPELGFWGNPVKFPDKCNCLWFSNEQDLIKCINWAWSHPEEAQVIADRGRKWLIESNQTWQGRAKIMLDAIENDDQDEIDRVNIDKFNRERMEAIHNAN